VFPLLSDGGRPPIANKSKGQQQQQQSNKLRLDTPEVTPRGKPPIPGGGGGGAMYSHSPFPRYSHPSGGGGGGGLFTPAGPSPGFVSLQPPATPQGRNLLQRTLANMNLPSEDWVEEMKELNGQLIECLEQLFERETELQQQRGDL
jgi:hypothetical protein